MGIRSKNAVRCLKCRLHAKDCICSIIPRLKLKTNIIVAMHHSEWIKTTASAPLFALAAPDNCEIRLRGLKGIAFNDKDIVVPQRQTFLLYPRNNAQVLTRELIKQDPKPVTLIVPDGNWRQAAKITQREPVLSKLKTVVLPDMGPSKYKLRHEPKTGGLATFEAIARALKIIEGESVYQELDKIFVEMVDRTMATRGHR